MKIALPPFHKHFVSYSSYFIYTLLWFQTWRITPQLKHGLDGGLIFLFGLFTAVAFIIVSALNAIFRSTDQRKFYLWLIFFIILPPAAFIIII